MLTYLKFKWYIGTWYILYDIQWYIQTNKIKIKNYEYQKLSHFINDQIQLFLSYKTVLQ